MVIFLVDDELLLLDFCSVADIESLMEVIKGLNLPPSKKCWMK